MDYENKNIKNYNYKNIQIFKSLKINVKLFILEYFPKFSLVNIIKSNKFYLNYFNLRNTFILYSERFKNDVISESVNYIYDVFLKLYQNKQKIIYNEALKCFWSILNDISKESTLNIILYNNSEKNNFYLEFFEKIEENYSITLVSESEIFCIQNEEIFKKLNVFYIKVNESFDPYALEETLKVFNLNLIKILEFNSEEIENYKYGKYNFYSECIKTLNKFKFNNLLIFNSCIANNNKIFSKELGMFFKKHFNIKCLQLNFLNDIDLNIFKGTFNSLNNLNEIRILNTDLPINFFLEIFNKNLPFLKSFFFQNKKCFKLENDYNDIKIINKIPINLQNLEIIDINSFCMINIKFFIKLISINKNLYDININFDGNNEKNYFKLVELLNKLEYLSNLKIEFNKTKFNYIFINNLMSESLQFFNLNDCSINDLIKVKVNCPNLLL